MALRRLIGIGRRPDDDVLVGPRRPRELLAKHPGEIELDRDDVPYRSSEGRSARFSNALTKQNVHWWAHPVYGLSDHLSDMP